MNCEDTAERLSAYLDGELEPQAAARLREHLAGCPQCGARLRDLGELDRALDALEGMPAPVSFARRVRLAAAAGSLAGTEAPGRARVADVLSRVAAVLIAAVGLWVGVTAGLAANPGNGNGEAAAFQEDELDLQVGAVSAAPEESLAGAYLALVDEGE